ncbi:MAG: alkaline phosphatase family protein [Thermoanaerobaculia bacterium]
MKNSAKILGLLLLLLLAACGPAPDASRVLILGLDGMDPQTIDLLMSEGKMPNFAKLRQEGAYGRLLTQKPILSPIIWTTIATGKGPEEHGIGHFVAVADSGEEIPASSDLRQVKALWNIASDAGKQVATVGWWATWPPEAVNGSVVSDHIAYHFLFEDGLTGAGDGAETKTHPPELYQRIGPRLRRPDDIGYEELQRFVDVSRAEYDKPFDFDDDLAHFRWALATAHSYRDIGLDLWRAERPDLGMVYVEGTDSTSHLFGHLFRMEGLGGELAEQQRKFGRTVEEMYLFADELLGEFIAAMDESTTLMVLSDHGFELGVLHDDPSRTRTMRRVSERFHRIEGILYLYGHRVKEHARIDRASILDITPTVLALLGVPPARDMPGRVLDEAFTVDLDGERVASYEDGAGGGTAVAAGAESDLVRQAQLEHLKSLGYLGGGEAPADTAAVSSPQAERNLAAIHFQSGRFEEAARIYQRLVAADPEDASLRASFAGALGSLGRFDLAQAELTKAIELQPLNAEAYHNRAVISERQGEIENAVADYETVLRYQPDYEPSKAALIRLTGRSTVRTVRNEAELQAARLIEQASAAARRANYPEATRLLDEAEQTAPDFVLVYQYRSNVAYLMGDVAGAIAALEKGLEIEPDNALFQTNLDRLRSKQSG